MTQQNPANVEARPEIQSRPAGLEYEAERAGPRVTGAPRSPATLSRKRRLLRPVPVLLVLAALLCAGFFGFQYWRGKAATLPFETTVLRRGNLVATVSATGTLSAVGTVTVGTQVSGTMDRVFADFNDRVKEGDLLAVLDTEALDAVVSDSEASVSQARAALLQTQADLSRAESQVLQAKAEQAEAQAMLARNRTLFEEGYISEQEFTPLQTAAATATAAVVSANAQVASAAAGITSAQAAVASAEALLAQARKNRRNAEIRAPISGVIIKRSVEEGQTVAATFSTPELFVIAEDLARMEILAQVDESDVGLVEPGQTVKFTVAAYPGRTFAGTVRERRLQPETIQNVVHYTVVVTAGNDDGLLLPGMTATVDFIVDRLEDALLVPSAALRFDPPDEIRAAARERQRRQERAGAQSPAQPTPGFSPDVAELWTPAEEGRMHPVLVRVLATDGAATAIAPLSDSNPTVRPGLEVVTRMNETENNPFK